ncbi:hypothetical protein BDR06DRAFT_955016 [Suillus hirtellus]|nr:hypothetical protein BDR06DRAFT_955016 [Suillus hirtellus]
MHSLHKYQRNNPIVRDAFCLQMVLLTLVTLCLPAYSLISATITFCVVIFKVLPKAV